jgi:hypothetical protein
VHFSKIIFISYAQNQKYWKAKPFLEKHLAQILAQLEKKLKLPPHQT